jgi:hypothetical protein
MHRGKGPSIRRNINRSTNYFLPTLCLLCSWVFDILCRKLVKVLDVLRLAKLRGGLGVGLARCNTTAHFSVIGTNIMTLFLLSAKLPRYLQRTQFMQASKETTTVSQNTPKKNHMSYNLPLTNPQLSPTKSALPSSQAPSTFLPAAHSHQDPTENGLSSTMASPRTPLRKSKSHQTHA